MIIAALGVNLFSYSQLACLIRYIQKQHSSDPLLLVSVISPLKQKYVKQKEIVEAMKFVYHLLGVGTGSNVSKNTAKYATRNQNLHYSHDNKDISLFNHTKPTTMLSSSMKKISRI